MSIIEDEEMGGDARIEGHRIAVYHIMSYIDAGFEPEVIAEESVLPNRRERRS